MGLSVHDRICQGFEPCGATFWAGGEDEVGVASLEVALACKHPLKLPTMMPKALVLVKMGYHPSLVFG